MNQTGKLLVVALVLGCLLAGPLQSLNWAADLAPTSGAALPAQPRRVVSLIPAATEIIRALGAAEHLVGLTVHDLPASAGDDHRIVGDFFSPSLKLIAAREPDLIIISNLHRQVQDHFAGQVPLLDLSVGTLEQAFSHIALLGRLLERPAQATVLIAAQRRQLEMVRESWSAKPTEKRPRMIRLMSTEPLAAPGDDSFQNDYIRAVGGIPPAFGRNGDIIAISAEELTAFDPQVIYLCGARGRERVFSHPLLQNLTAIREERVFSFDCDLTCRAGVDIGTFTHRLAETVYGAPLPITQGEH